MEKSIIRQWITAVVMGVIAIIVIGQIEFDVTMRKRRTSIGPSPRQCISFC